MGQAKESTTASFFFLSCNFFFLLLSNFPFASTEACVTRVEQEDTLHWGNVHVVKLRAA